MYETSACGLWVSSYGLVFFSDYVSCLMRTVFALSEISHMNEDGLQLLIEPPPPLCSDYERPNKDEAVRNLQTRFNHCPPGGSLCSPGMGMPS